MRYWEIIADNLSKAGFSWGYVSASDSNGRTIWIADVHRGDGERFVVGADELLTALELRSMSAPGPAGSHRHKALPRRPPNAHLSAPALHLPTPRATGRVEWLATGKRSLSFPLPPELSAVCL